MLRESLMQNEIINSSIYRKPTFECGVIAVFKINNNNLLPQNILPFKFCLNVMIGCKNH